MKGHATMGFFSRLMGGSDKQATATSEFEILAPISGELVNLENTNDPAFSSRAVGDGVAVVPQEGTVCAPVSGTVAALFPTEHALGIMSDDSSAQVMLHIGIVCERSENSTLREHASGPVAVKEPVFWLSE